MGKENVVYNTYNGILFGHKKKEMLPFTTMWMDSEGIILSEIRQRKTHITQMCRILKNK